MDSPRLPLGSRGTSEARAQAIALSGDLTLGDQLAPSATEGANVIFKELEPQMDAEAQRALMKVLDQARASYRDRLRGTAMPGFRGLVNQGLPAAESWLRACWLLCAA